MGGGELILVLGAVLILFGAKKIPEFAKGLGQGMKEFKKASREVQDELENAMNTEAPPPPPKKIAPPPESEPVSADVDSHSSTAPKG
jgi:sec-independent protein translocase protein TatA